MAHRQDPPGGNPSLKLYMGDVQFASDKISREVRGWWRDDRADGDDWVGMPEVIGSEEIMKLVTSSDAKSEENWDEYKKDPVYDSNLPTNIIKGRWPSVKAYLEAHFRLIREDAVAPLRSAVARVRDQPHMGDDRETHVYTQVFMVGALLTRAGMAIRIEFSTDRAEKGVRWAQSARLMQGSIVALSPARDSFASICEIAIVAARPLEGGLDQNPPMIDLFWEKMEKLRLDPTQEWIMVEARTGFFEANRHVLTSLQKASTEKLPLEKHVVRVSKTTMPPGYIQDNPTLNLTSLEIPTKQGYENTLVEAVDDTDYSRVNVLKDFPKDMVNGMDSSQMLACKSMLTQRLAIIQGPPGTGKTFVSVAGLKVMIHNLGPYDSPIIVTAQTNHALDQLLNHILQFETKVVRIGGRCDKKNKDIVERTLFKLQEANHETPEIRAGMSGAWREYNKICGDIKDVLGSLEEGGIFRAETFLKFGILTENLVQSLKRTAHKPGVYDDSSDESENGEDGENEASAPEAVDEGDIRQWLGEDQIVYAARTQPANMGLPLEELDLEYDQLQSIEDEAAASRDDAEIEALSGHWIPFGHRHTVRHKQDPSIRQTINELSSVRDLYNIPMNQRGRLYQGMEKIFIEKLRIMLEPLLLKYRKVVEDYKVVKALNNYKLIRMLGTKIVGCTTTGLAKYRPLLAALAPRTLLVEEAAETREATVIAGLVGSLEQLILVGDHKQLQASCNVQELEKAPFNLSISMFERLVNNHLPFTMLNTQRRMISDVRKLLTVDPQPFYKGLNDHTSVLDRIYNRKHIPGMAKRAVWFFQHEWPEAVNSDFSRYNRSEAQMIAGFFNHLVLNGTEASKITVLTFYNGQRKEILKQLKNHDRLSKHNKYFNVFTVDSYQGEENDVILLSLVRSNGKAQIGFLSTKNRLVVALSRARRGLYLFGNAVTLSLNEKINNEDVAARDLLWRPILRYMARTNQLDMNAGLPITCQNHAKTISLFDPIDWAELAGGCEEQCGGVLPCGHSCVLSCHPFEHNIVECGAPCEAILDCGHRCSNNCGQDCRCNACNPANPSRESQDIREVASGTDEDDQVGVWMTEEPVLNQDLPIHGPNVPIHARSGGSSASTCKVCGVNRRSSPTFDEGEYISPSGFEEASSHLSSLIRHKGGENTSGSGQQRRAIIRGHSQLPIMVRGQLSVNSGQALQAWNNFDPKAEDARLGKMAEKEARSRTDQSVGMVRDNYTGIRVDDSGRVKDRAKKAPVLSVPYDNVSDQKQPGQSEEKLIDI